MAHIPWAITTISRRITPSSSAIMSPRRRPTAWFWAMAPPMPPRCPPPAPRSTAPAIISRAARRWAWSASVRLAASGRSRMSPPGRFLAVQPMPSTDHSFTRPIRPWAPPARRWARWATARPQPWAAGLWWRPMARSRRPRSRWAAWPITMSQRPFRRRAQGLTLPRRRQGPALPAAAAPAAWHPAAPQP